MSLPYDLRLACLCLAAFFVVHLGVGLVVSISAPALIRWAAGLRASRAALLLFVLRLTPAAIGVAVVTLLCIPAYLLFEPAADAEEVGGFCVAGSLLCALACGLSFARSVRAALYSVRYARHCRIHGRPLGIAGARSVLWEVDDCCAGLALLGLFRARFVISAPLLKALPPPELTAALRHERAHWSAGDNLKRLLFLMSPELLPFFGGFGRLEQAWARFAEWAADDRAVSGDPELSLSLAAALVRVARTGLAAAVPPLMSALITRRCDLAERVNRLLDPQPERSLRVPKTVGILTAATLLLTGTAILPVLTHTATLNAFYRALETLMH